MEKIVKGKRKIALTAVPLDRKACFSLFAEMFSLSSLKCRLTRLPKQFCLLLADDKLWRVACNSVPRGPTKVFYKVVLRCLLYWLAWIYFHDWSVHSSKIFESLNLGGTLTLASLYLPTYLTSFRSMWFFFNNTFLFCPSIPDVGDIQSRLIDHRPVIQGEIRYFVREFEVRSQSWLDSVDIHITFREWNDCLHT